MVMGCISLTLSTGLGCNTFCNDDELPSSRNADPLLSSMKTQVSQSATHKWTSWAKPILQSLCLPQPSSMHDASLRRMSSGDSARIARNFTLSRLRLSLITFVITSGFFGHAIMCC